MIAADLIRTALLLTLPVAYWFDLLTLNHLYAITILADTAHVVFGTAYASFFVRLVDRDQYLEANGKLSATRSISFKWPKTSRSNQYATDSVNSKTIRI